MRFRKSFISSSSFSALRLYNSASVSFCLLEMRREKKKTVRRDAVDKPERYTTDDEKVLRMSWTTFVVDPIRRVRKLLKAIVGKLSMSVCIYSVSARTRTLHSIHRNCLKTNYAQYLLVFTSIHFHCVFFNFSLPTTTQFTASFYAVTALKKSAKIRFCSISDT